MAPTAGAGGFDSRRGGALKKTTAPANPAAYLAAKAGWQRDRVETLRALVSEGTALDGVIKRGHLVYAANGPGLLIRAEEQRRTPATTNRGFASNVTPAYS